eukprot:3157861-Amphidinium_carterae.2
MRQNPRTNEPMDLAQRREFVHCATQPLCNCHSGLEPHNIVRSQVTECANCAKLLCTFTRLTDCASLGCYTKLLKIVAMTIVFAPRFAEVALCCIVKCNDVKTMTAPLQVRAFACIADSYCHVLIVHNKLIVPVPLVQGHCLLVIMLNAIVSCHILRLDCPIGLQVLIENHIESIVLAPNAKCLTH